MKARLCEALFCRMAVLNFPGKVDALRGQENEMELCGQLKGELLVISGTSWFSDHETALRLREPDSNITASISQD